MKSSRWIVAVLVVATGLIACGGDGDTKPSAAGASQAPAAAAASPSSPSKNVAHESSRLTLQPGVTTQSDAGYTTGKFAPRATFHTPQLAYPFFPENDTRTVVVFDSQVGALVFFSSDEVFDATGKAVPAPDDLTTWASTNPNVDVGSVSKATIGPLEGTQVDGVVTSAYHAPECDEPCVRLVAIGSKDSFVFTKGDHFRLISLPYKGHALGIVLASDKSGFPQLAKAARPLLASLRFH